MSEQVNPRLERKEIREINDNDADFKRRIELMRQSCVDHLSKKDNLLDECKGLLDAAKQMIELTEARCNPSAWRQAWLREYEQLIDKLTALKG